MKRSVVLRAKAVQDVEEAVDSYLSEASRTVALRFIEALRQVYQQIAEHPLAGSPRYGHELDLPGLRSCRLSKFPYMVFYLTTETSVDVWRVLHSRQDMASWIEETAVSNQGPVK